MEILASRSIIVIIFIFMFAHFWQNQETHKFNKELIELFEEINAVNEQNERHLKAVEELLKNHFLE